MVLSCPASEDALRLLPPFDPIVWDRSRLEAFWGWPNRFEANTPAPKRVRGYYARPMLWRGQVIDWANAAAINEGTRHVEPGFVCGAVRRPLGPGGGRRSLGGR